MTENCDRFGPLQYPKGNTLRLPCGEKAVNLFRETIGVYEDAQARGSTPWADGMHRMVLYLYMQ
jgi:hypothetical protein